MKSINFIKQIRNYAIISFLVPLIAVNSCLLIYKFVGNTKNIVAHLNLNWDKDEHTYTWNEYNRILNKPELYTITNCPKHAYLIFWNSIDNQTISVIPENAELLENLRTSNKVKSITIKPSKFLNVGCIKNLKNHQFLYSLLKKFSWLETILVHTKQKNSSGFAEIRNPYFYGEVSISRTVRYFPSVLIFKSLIFLSSFLLFSYWKNNLNLFSELKNKNILVKFSKKFFYFGIFSCIFLALHAAFLGLDFDSKLFATMRKLIIILFILFEVFAQIFLTASLFKFKKELKKFINLLILKIKIIFVTIVFFATCIAFVILAFGDPSTEFKHILEWNYFAFLLLYYLLSRLLWKKS